MSKEIIQKLQSQISTKELVDFTIALCSKNTVNPPGNEYLVKDILLKKFKKMGLKIKVHEKIEGRTNVVGVIGKGSPKVAVLGHMDTVPVEGQKWKTDPFKPVLKGGKIYARGAQDSKGSSAAVFLAAKAFLKTNPKFKGTLYVIASADEEKGDTLGMAYLLKEGYRFDYALIPDAGYMDTAIYGEKGVVWVEIESSGKAYHGSHPERGINAIAPLAKLFDKLRGYDWEKLKYDKKNFRSGVVLNIGKISGGNADNIVPSSASMSLMWRYPLGVNKNQILSILDKFIKEVGSDKSLHKYEAGKTKLKYRIGVVSVPFISDLDSKIALAFKEASRQLKMKMSFKTTSGQTTAKMLYHNGAQVIDHYPQSPGVEVSHMPNEYVKIRNLEKASLLYALTLNNLFAGE